MSSLQKPAFFLLFQWQCISCIFQLHQLFFFSALYSNLCFVLLFYLEYSSFDSLCHCCCIKNKQIVSNNLLFFCLKLQNITEKLVLFVPGNANKVRYRYVMIYPRAFLLCLWPIVPVDPLVCRVHPLSLSLALLLFRWSTCVLLWCWPVVSFCVCSLCL